MYAGDSGKLAIQDDNFLWAALARTSFESRLPLRNLQVRSRMGQVQTIDSIRLETQVYSAATKDNTKMLSLFDSQKLPQNWHRIPHLTIFLLKCETFDAYKNTQREVVRKFISGFRPSEKEAKGPADRFARECIVLYLPLGARANAEGNVSATATLPTSTLSKNSKTYRKVFDKLRSDFSKDLVYKLDLYDGETNPEPQWEELIARIKQAVVRSFEQRCDMFDQEIRRIALNSKLPGALLCDWLGALVLIHCAF